MPSIPTSISFPTPRAMIPVPPHNLCLDGADTNDPAQILATPILAWRL